MWQPPLHHLPFTPPPPPTICATAGSALQLPRTASLATITTNGSTRALFLNFLPAWAPGICLTVVQSSCLRSEPCDATSIKCSKTFVADERRPMAKLRRLVCVCAHVDGALPESQTTMLYTRHSQHYRPREPHASRITIHQSQNITIRIPQKAAASRHHRARFHACAPTTRCSCFVAENLRGGGGVRGDGRSGCAQVEAGGNRVHLHACLEECCNCCGHGGDAKCNVDDAWTKDAASCEGVAAAVAAAAAAWRRVCVISGRVRVDNEINLRGNKGEGEQGASCRGGCRRKQASLTSTPASVPVIHGGKFLRGSAAAV